MKRDNINWMRSRLLHVADRAKQRLNMKLDVHAYFRLCDQIKTSKKRSKNAILVREESSCRQMWKVYFNSVWFFAVYDKDNNLLITVMDEGMFPKKDKQNESQSRDKRIPERGRHYRKGDLGGRRTI